ncbi:50S ribosomal protein L32 [Pontibacter sp. SGAir0037]|uniref:50S ribosomal protein L32 n=1 Tax=Pontibacter sp. SGAir0037 TaxID=2571030 RepID=UPI0010CD4E26|nr:50S ribosomal protein L32 [Pontibacter sp. SGAir0037]QCR22638.1 50S ribosomal protein L32 [Pontibacter sp. SGAir0037]
MAHPKRKISKTRRDKRRTHQKLSEKAIAICPNTDTPHLYHHAYVVEGDLYHKGKLAIKNYTTNAI